MPLHLVKHVSNMSPLRQSNIIVLSVHSINQPRLSTQSNMYPLDQTCIHLSHLSCILILALFTPIEFSQPIILVYRLYGLQPQIIEYKGIGNCVGSVIINLCYTERQRINHTPCWETRVVGLSFQFGLFGFGKQLLCCWMQELCSEKARYSFLPLSHLK